MIGEHKQFYLVWFGLFFFLGPMGGLKPYFKIFIFSKWNIPCMHSMLGFQPKMAQMAASKRK